ncbi:PAS domain-containing hybrid sensor histidine kinase/response regulator [Salinimicrobium oceani]|uniref:histidine kinase n=1 Tax=Salinimicrobium oceani TaxID=2722702 RepID=A0ABX1CUI5_9FLAO|nr:PAS domain-containing hybrid sensor histidine kinase/response regulator [Salinimicrobium oceani]NJW51948.1 response regulator [Salinimicrobium oceani]
MDFPEESAEDLYNNAPFGYVSFLPDGQIVKVNRTFLEWFGLSEEEVVFKRSIQSFFKIGGKIYFETHFFPLLKMQGYIKEVQFDLVQDQGKILPALITVNKLERASSKTVVYRASIVDISDRKKYEQVLIEQRKKAEQNARAKAEFLSTISHEIRTPLNAIVGVGNLLQSTPLDEKQKEYARLLQLSSHSLLELVNNLLDLSKLESNKTSVQSKEFNIKELLEVLYNTYAVKAKEKSIQLETAFPEELPAYLNGDPIKLKQVLTNLIGNAIKFTRQGKVLLKIKVKNRDENSIVLDFEVEDTGIGIPSDNLEKIFQEFSQASYEVNLEFGGTGLGLTISQKLLQLQGSELKVASEEGKGSRFSFELGFEIPAVQQKSSSPSTLKKDLKELSGKVLVVDDNKTNLYIISKYLEDWKIPFSTASSGAKAIAKAEEEFFDVILMDLHMPQINGYETSEEILAQKKDKTPTIIALSASGRGDLDVKLKRAGMSAYVSKPFHPLELQETLLKFLPKSSNGIAETVTEIDEPEAAFTSASDSERSFDLSRLNKVAKNNAEILNKLLGSFTKSMELYKDEFSIAAEKRDAEKIADLIHKNKTTVHYLQAEKLSAHIDAFQEQLTKPTAQREALEQKRKTISKEFETILAGLRDSK